MWKLTFYHGARKYEYDIKQLSNVAAHLFEGVTTEGKRIIWSGEYLLEKTSEEPLTN